YRTGTVAITAGQTTVTGTGTNFSANARVGDALLGPDGNWYEVTNIASTTVLSILPAYKGATVTGGTYAITPVQGYTKTLADKFNDIANTWGSTLAGLGSVSTENVVPVAKGGTGGNTQALGRSGLGLKTAAVADIVGTVSQSGGIPTGAIIERGSNANGEYIRFADGSQICWGIAAEALVTTAVVGSGFQSPTTSNFIYPIGFAVPPRLFPGGYFPAGGASRAWANPAVVGSGSCTLVAHGFANNATVQVAYMAIGRWFS
ncbi:hypothetical protein ACNFCI_23930, partial [Pseudomonas sp. NY15356]|uniref:hypothetical protein n=1 Tax=Pseudomonas sp. NY15356 TaxID=3400352 RepID=UPI003A836AED